MKKYWTIAMQYDVDGEPCDPPHHIEDRIIALMQIMHEMGFGVDVAYGYAEKKILEKIDTKSERRNW